MNFKSAYNWCKKQAGKVVLGVTAAIATVNAGVVQAQTTIEFPDTGVVLTDYVDAYAAELGPGVKAAMVLTGAFLVLRVFIKWVRRAA